jgi:hypothetical protein
MAKPLSPDDLSRGNDHIAVFVLLALIALIYSGFVIALLPGGVLNQPIFPADGVNITYNEALDRVVLSMNLSQEGFSEFRVRAHYEKQVLGSPIELEFFTFKTQSPKGKYLVGPNISTLTDSTLLIIETERDYNSSEKSLPTEYHVWVLKKGSVPLLGKSEIQQVT